MADDMKPSTVRNDYIFISPQRLSPLIANIDVLMATADEQIRVSSRVKRHLEQRRAEGESYNDVLKRLLEEHHQGSFEDGFGRWSDDEADRVREQN